MKILYLYEKIQLKIEELKKEAVLVREKNNKLLKIISLSKLYFFNIIQASVRFFCLLLGDSSENFLIFSKLGKDSLIVCNNSFCRYKRIEKKIRFLSKTAFVLVLITTIITSSILYLFMPGKPTGYAASAKYWTQTDWTGGDDGGSLATHTANSTETCDGTTTDPDCWEKYSASSASASITDDTEGEIKLSTTNTSWTQSDWSGNADTVSTAAEPGDRATWNKFYSKDAYADVTTTPGEIKESLISGVFNSLLTTDDSSSDAASSAVSITLNETLTNSDTTITISDTSNFPSSTESASIRTIQIDSEQIIYTAISGNDLTGVTRGANSTSAATHFLGTAITAIGFTLGGKIQSGFNKTGNAKSSLLRSKNTGTDTSLYICDYDHAGADWTPTNGDAYDLDATASIGIAGTHCNIGTFTVASGTTSVKAYDSATSSYGKLIIYAANATITGTLSATGKGYAAYGGPGVGSTLGRTPYGYGPGGGSYGGIGGTASNDKGNGGLSYGSIILPEDLGSGGGYNGGSGGGVIKLNISGTLTNSGSIISSGATGSAGSVGNSSGGGGSGGTIYINTSILTGTSSSIVANGGSGGSGASNGWIDGGSGGGGRIAIYYTDKSGYTGSVTAYGGTVNRIGGAGTIYYKNIGQSYGDLKIDNNNTVNNNIVSISTPIASNLTVNTLTIQNKGDAVISSGVTLTALNTGAWTVGNLTVNGSFVANGITGLTINGTFSINANTSMTSLLDGTRDVTINSGGVLSHIANTTTKTHFIDWNLANLTINSGGKVDVTGKGFAAGQGSGAGGNGNGYSNSGGGGGGAYGGNGGNSHVFTAYGGQYGGAGGTVGYGSNTAPIDLGSGGGSSAGTGANGGGLVKLNISNTLTVNGELNAIGGVDSSTQSYGNNGGAGSGGSINITTNVLAGGGSISAAGGSAGVGARPGGGGGGRIAMYYVSSTFSAANITAKGGSGSQYGGAGTIYQKAVTSYQANRDESGGDLTVDNNSVTGAVTPMIDTTNTFTNVTVQKNANLSVPSGKVLTPTNLIVQNSGMVTVASGGTLTTTNFTLDTSGTFSAVGSMTTSNLTVNGGTFDLKTNLSINPTRNVAFSGAANLIVRAGVTLTHDANTTAKTNYIDWTLGGNVTIEATGSINADSKGYSGNNGTGGGQGLGSGDGSGGGGHAGSGGAGTAGSGGSSSGDNNNSPSQLGSAGGSTTGGAGGGYIKITAANATVEGNISASGANGATNRGGGAGGSVWLAISGAFAGTNGSAVIAANGGNGNGTGGGGGGGIVYATYGSKTYNGTSSATGGTGNVSGNSGSAIAFIQTRYYTVNDQPIKETILTVLTPNQDSSWSGKITKVVENIFSKTKDIFAYAFSIPTANAATGEFTSATFNSNSGNVSYARISWNATVPAGTTLKFRIASKSVDSGWQDSDFIGSDGTTSTYYTASAGENIWPALSGAFPYLKFRAYFDNASTYNEILLNDVTITYSPSGYPASQELISSKYYADKGNNDNQILNLTWSETKPANTDIKFQIRTASSAVNLDSAAWCGPDDATPGSCNSSTYFTSNTGQTIDDINSDGANDQWVQYKVFLSSTDGVSTAILSDISLNYANNLTGNFTSSSYNTEAYWNVPYQLTWDEDATLPANTTLKFQIATSSDNSTWTSFLGPNNTSSIATDFYSSENLTNCSKTTQTVTCVIPQISISDGYSDQYIKYRAYYDSSVNKNDSPILSSVTFRYDQNEAPAITMNSATQNSDGTVSVSYNISDTEQTSVNVSILADIGVTLDEVLSPSLDPGSNAVTVSDATLLPSSGTIQIGSEQIAYTSKSGNDLTVDMSSGVRASNGTKYASHSQGSTVWIKGMTIASGESDPVSSGVITPANISSAPATKTATWTIKTDLPDIYTTTAKIRVSANDSQTGNPTGAVDSSGNPSDSADQSNVALDTRDPLPAIATNVPASIDANGTDLLIGISNTAGSEATKMRFSNSSLASILCTDSSPSWENYATSRIWSDLNITPDANGVYTLYWQFKDDNCNMITGSSTTPRRITGVQLGDISITPIAQYKILVWWNAVPDPVNGDASNTFTRYHAWRAIDDPSGVYTDITDTLIANGYDLAQSTFNYFIDDESGAWLDPTLSYYYKITAESAKGTSAFGIPQGGSAAYPVVNGIPNGSPGGETGAIPSLLHDAVSEITNITDSGATIAWTATSIDNKPSDSTVLYTSDSQYVSSYLYSQGVPTLVDSGNSHSVTLSGLASNTTYHYQLKSCGVQGNCGNTDTDYTFTTTQDSTSPSAISDLAIKSPFSNNLTSDFVTLTWTSPGDDNNVGTATSYDLRYSTSAIDDTNWDSATQITNEPSPRITGSTEEITITGLTSGTYYFAIKTRDELSNESSLSNVLSVIIPARRDTTAPIITDATVTASNITATSATISWTTDENSSSLVDFYDISSATAYDRTQGDSEVRITAHTVDLTGLIPERTYNFQVKSVDDAGNAGTKSGIQFTTLAALTGTQPVITGGPTATKISATSFAITWSTDVSSDSVVGYGVDGLSPSYPLEKGDITQTSSHSVTLTGLVPLITYNYEVRSRNGDKTISATGTFTTEESVDNLPPLFSKNPTVTAITSSTATITWSTTERSDSYVYFGTTSKLSYDQYSSSQQNALQSSVLEHSVQLTSLSASTAYYLVARSMDSSSNFVTSSEYSFNTTAGAAVECPTVSCGGGSSVSIDTTAPTISNIKTSDITASSVTIEWDTNEKSDSIVSYGDNDKYGNIAGLHDDNLYKHVVILYKLEGDKSYNYRVSSKDSSGNLAQSDNFTFKTLSVKDLTPEEKKKEEEKQKDVAKEIQVKIEELIKQGMDEETVRDIIAKATQPPAIANEGPILSDITNSSVKMSWTTDRKSNSVVRFKVKEEGINPENSTFLKQYGSFTALDQIHNVILSGLLSGTVYQYQVQSSDILGNTGKSEWKEFATAVTPSIYDVIITDINLNSAIINWKTNVVSSSIVEYGKTIEYNLKQEDKDNIKSAKHIIKLNNLKTGTAYHFRVRGFDDKGNALVSDDYTFKTFTLPLIEEYSVEEIGETVVKLKWKTNVETDASIKYTDKETSASKKQGEDSLASIHSFNLRSLAPGKEYALQIQGRDVYGNQIVSPEINITTLIDKTSPVITQVRTEVATSSGAGSVVQTIISWKTDEPATSKIFWEEGITQDVVPKNSNQEDLNYTTNHIVVITNFKPSTVYRFRTAGSDRSGNESQSQDITILIPEKKKSVIQIIITNFEDTFSWVKNLGL